MCIDTGAESSLVNKQCAKFMYFTYQGTVQADVETPLTVIGEIKGIEMTRGTHVFRLVALVVRENIGDTNAAAKKETVIKGRDIVNYDSTFEQWKTFFGP